MPRTRTSSILELLVELRRDDREPLHRQLEHGLRAAIRDGRLAPSALLPSSRALAEQLGVSRGIVVEGYEQLVAEGYLASRPGGATQVARTAAVRVPRRMDADAPEFAFDFRPGRPDVDEFPRAVWLRALRRVLAQAPSQRLSYLSGRGTIELRTALATYLNRVRGTAADPTDIVICAGFAQGIGLIARAVRARGGRRFAVEDPSDAEYRAILADAGLEVVAIPVDDDGILVDRLAAAGADAVVVTAAHQYPTGAVLSAERRAALVDWAEANHGLIVEDDYDAEFRYDRAPIGAIQGLSPDRVVYTGSASKILAPGLRLGWLVAPNDLVEAIASAKLLADMGSAAFDQLAFADVIGRGELDRHLRRMRSTYRARRDALLAALARHLPDLRPVGASAGIHVLAWLPASLDETRILEAAAAARIGMSGVTARRVAPGPGGLIFGYGGIAESRIEDGIRLLAEAIAGTAASADRSEVVAVYGTLRRGERNHDLLTAAAFLGTAQISGRLHVIRASSDRHYPYPALVADPDGRVVVELYRIADREMLARLDRLEAYDPADEPGSEYVRRTVPILNSPIGSASTYVYRGPVDLLGPPLDDGDWVAHAADRRR